MSETTTPSRAPSTEWLAVESQGLASTGPRDAKAIQPANQLAAPIDRDAILSSLYAERSTLARARRLGEISPADEEYLAEINQYIDHWERQEPRAFDDVWGKLEKAARSLMAIQAEIEAQRSK